MYKETLFLVNDNEEKSFLIALDKRSGRELWKVDRDEKSNWATPFIWDHHERTEMYLRSSACPLFPNGRHVALRAGGHVADRHSDAVGSQGLLYVAAVTFADSTFDPFGVRPEPRGRHPHKEDNEDRNDYIVWCQKKAGPYHPSPVVHGGFVYVLLDKGFLACHDAKTGKEIYRERIDPNSDKFTASPWAAGGKIYCLSEDGDTFVIRAGPTFEVLAKNSLDEMCLATPALIRGNILLRTSTSFHRVRGKVTGKDRGFGIESRGPQLSFQPLRALALFFPLFGEFNIGSKLAAIWPEHLQFAINDLEADLETWAHPGGHVGNVFQVVPFPQPAP